MVGKRMVAKILEDQSRGPGRYCAAEVWLETDNEEELAVRQAAETAAAALAAEEAN